MTVPLIVICFHLLLRPSLDVLRSCDDSSFTPVCFYSAYSARKTSIVN